MMDIGHSLSVVMSATDKRSATATAASSSSSGPRSYRVSELKPFLKNVNIDDIIVLEKCK